MLKLRDGMNIYASIQAMQVHDEFKSDPRSGHVLHYKRLEKHRYALPKSGQLHYQINEMQLAGLLAGLNFEIMGEFYEINYDRLY